jgi:hypothetical protein
MRAGSWSVPVRTWRIGRQLVAYLATITAISVISVSATAQPSTASENPGLTIGPAMLHRLTVMSLRGARLSGDRWPAWIDVVATNRATALAGAMHGDKIPGAARQEVYLIIMKGNFTFAGAAPLHGRAPKGRYMSVTLGIKTLQTMDIGLSNRPPAVPVRSFGHVYSLMARN